MSKQTLQPVRGTHDLLPEAAGRFRFIETAALELAGRYGFAEVRTPLFEFSEVFHRTLGDSSDVVTKETYSFEDRGGTGITLRPEFTASAVRAFLSNGLTQQLPVKWFYTGPAFRYERPQKGRQRQFHQIGVELLGAAEPAADIESIALAYDVLRELGLGEHVTLELNTLGDTDSRDAYRAALVAYYQQHVDGLSDDSKMRLEKNPLRILDSKNEGDRKINAGAPAFGDYLNKASQSFFKAVTDGLGALGISYRLNDKLVRGLDYYSHTVFEFTTEALGAQNTVLAGGRYDGLVEMMGGTPTPGVGWAAGIERLDLLMQEVGGESPSLPKPLVLVPIGDEAESHALVLAHSLRQAGHVVELAYKGNAGKRMKKADKLGAVAALSFGENELSKGVVTLRELGTGEETEIKLVDLVASLDYLRG